MGEDVSEQLTTIEETILKLAGAKKKLLRLALKKKIRVFDLHAAEQDLFYLKRNYRNGA
jgi:hypothetical protein